MKNKISKLIKLSDKLDQYGFYHQSSELDSLIKKVAESDATSLVTPAVSAQPSQQSSRPTLTYMKGLQSLFGGNPQKIQTYEKLKERKQQETYSENHDFRSMVKDMIQGHMQDLFPKLDCITKKDKKDFKNMSGKYVFDATIELTKDFFKFREGLEELIDELTGGDGTIKKCLDGIYLNDADSDDPTFKESFKKFKQATIKKAEYEGLDTSFLEAGLKYSVRVTLELK